MYAAYNNSHDDNDEVDDSSGGDAMQGKQSPVSNFCIAQKNKIFPW